MATIHWPQDDRGSVTTSQIGLFTRSRADWALLPDANNGSWWSLVAHDSEGIRQGREIVAAFIGPGVGKAENTWASQQLVTPDGVKSPVQVARIQVFDEDRFFEAVQSLIVVRNTRPVTVTGNQDSLAHLVRDFLLAVSVSDGQFADKLLRTLRDKGTLSRQNLDFLNIQMLASQERWKEIRDLEDFIQLATAPRPVQITQFMLEALWRIDFGERAAVDPVVALLRFNDLGERFNRLFDAADVPSNSAGQRLVALRAFEQASNSRLARVETAAEPVVQEWIHRLQYPSDPSGDLEPQDRAQSMFLAGRYRDVVDLALSNPTDASIVAQAIQAAAELDDTEVAILVAPLLTDDMRSEIPSTPWVMFATERVLSLAGGACESWSEWFRRLASEHVWPEASEVARRQCGSWPTGDLEAASSANTAADLLERSLSGPNAGAIDACMDLLCEQAARLAGFHGADKWVQNVIFALMFRPVTESICWSMLDLVQAVLRKDPSEERYGELVDACSDRTEWMKSRVCLPALLDLLDEYAMYPCPNPLKRQDFAAQACEALMWHGRQGNLDASDLELAGSLLRELGIDLGPYWTPQIQEIAASSEQKIEWDSLSGKTVVLYSLMDGIGDQFKKKLVGLCANVTVEVFSDRASSDRLHNAARSADFMIVDTHHAKHAATIGIDNARSKDLQIFPEGKGVTSFLRSLSSRMQAEHEQETA